MVDKLLKSEKIRFYNVDFLRFVFAIQVVIHHIACNWVGLNEFRGLLKSHFLWSNAVEYFFIIAGFFMFSNIDKNNDIIYYFKFNYSFLSYLSVISNWYYYYTKQIKNRLTLLTQPIWKKMTIKVFIIDNLIRQ